MNKYGFNFDGYIEVLAKTEEEARELVDELLGYTSYQTDHSESFSIDNIVLNDVEEDENG